jgi:hypothetical protein
MSRITRPRDPGGSDRGVDRLYGAADVFLKGMGEISGVLRRGGEVGVLFLDQVSTNSDPEQ